MTERSSIATLRAENTMEPERRAGMGSVDTDIRQLLEAQQGPQPLAHVYTGRSPCAHIPSTLAAARMTQFPSQFSSPSSPLLQRSVAMSVSSFTPYGVARRSTVMESRSAAICSQSEDSKPQARQAASADSDATEGEALPRSHGLNAASIPLPDDDSSVLRIRKRKVPEAMKSGDPLKSVAAAKQPPGQQGRLKQDPDFDDDAGTCCICMCAPEPDEIATINGCDHQFCFDCIDQWSNRENTCPLCKNRFTAIERLHRSKRQKAGEPVDTKKVKTRDQRADLPTGNHLEGLLAGIGAGNGLPPQIAQLIFSGFGGTTSVVDINATGPGVRQRTARMSAPRVRHAMNFEDSLLESDEEPDPAVEEEGFGNFRNRLRTMPFGSFPLMSSSLPTRVTLTSFPTAPMPPPQPALHARSFARNGHDADAGVSTDNPLEIADDSDDEIEVVQVSRRQV
mmetsp:Transcript_24184/g.41108  ORF Transcript_24184/g.41108 Transcript_24184/m.41108 type:complete len:452 (-) Transcript_24184:46-1401(-)